MDKLYYCVSCKRIFDTNNECIYCKSHEIKELTKNSPVNVIGSKLKGKVLKTNVGTAKILFKGEKNTSSIKDYEADKIRKVL